MKTGIKVMMIGIALTFGITEMNAQKKERKKKEQDLEYMQQKKTADEKRNRETEEKRKNDSIKRERFSDSLAEMRRSDSIRYSKMGPVDTINRPPVQDTLKNDMPPRMDKGVPPKDQDPKGPNPGIRKIEFGFIGRTDELTIV